MEIQTESERHIRAAQKHVKTARAAFGFQNHQDVIQEASDAFRICQGFIEEKEEAINLMHEAMQLINETLVLQWSLTSTDLAIEKSATERILQSSIYVFDTIDTFAIESHREEFSSEKENLRILIGNMDPTWERENQLITILKNQCDREGRELNLEETAETLLKIAKCYLDRAPDKFDMLRSCALVAASLVRKSTDAAMGVLKDIDKTLCESVPNLQSHDFSLFKISRNIFETLVKKMRDETASMLDGVDKIDCSETANELENESKIQKMEEECAFSVKSILRKVAEHYTNILQEISEKCLSIMGPAPCSFAHVGMGSLACQTITPYSTVKNCIVLANDCKKKPDYEDVLEYFRWYSVFFHIIIIYFGEFPLQLMGISSLNDWFSDFFTPCGIQMDIAMPLASKFPEGRRATRCKAWNLELIKTVKDMCRIASIKSDQENGCNLADILTTTCFINGSRKLYSKFKKRVRKIVSSEKSKTNGLTERCMKKIQDNIYRFSLEETIVDDDRVDVKKAILQTVTIFISTLGNLLEFEEKSCFDIIQRMCVEELITEEFAHQISFTVAIACKLALKVHMERKSQEAMVIYAKRHDDEQKAVDLYDSVGKHSVLTFFSVLFQFQKYLEKVIHSKGEVGSLKDSTFDRQDVNTAARIYIHFGLYQEALEYLSRQELGEGPPDQTALTALLKGLSQMKLGFYDEANESFSLRLAIEMSLPEVDQVALPMLTYYCIGENLKNSYKFSEAKENILKAKEIFESKSESTIRQQDKNVYVGVLQALADLHCSSGDYKISSEVYHDIIETMTSFDLLSNHRHMNLLFLSAKCLFKLGHYKESSHELEHARIFYDTSHRNRSVNGKIKHSSLIVEICFLLSECYFKLNRTDLAEKYCNETIDTAQKLKMTDQYNVAHIKMTLSKCYLTQCKYRKAAKQACEACTAVFEADPTPSDRSQIIHEAVQVIFRSLLPVRGKHTFLKDQYTDSDIKTALECATEVYKRINEEKTLAESEFERDKSILIRVIQRCLFEMGDYHCIINHYKSVLEGEPVGENASFYDLLLSQILDRPTASLSENVEQNGEYLIELSKLCNVRDSISHSGAIIIFVGWLLTLHKRCNQSQPVLEKIKQNISLEVPERKNIILHCAVKVAINAIQYYMDCVHDNNHSQTSRPGVTVLMDFSTKIYSIIQSQVDASQSLNQESAGLIIAIANGWMKLKDYKTALDMYNEALLLQEALANDNHSFKDLSSILDNIATCLNQLNRLNEATDYLQRAVAMKENRRKSRAFEDHSILQVRVKTAQCSFSLENIEEAAQQACEAFHEGLGMDPGMKRDETMLQAADIVQKCALQVSVHSNLHRNSEKFSADLIGKILDYTITLQDTIKDRAKQLGKKFTDLKDPILYTVASCQYAIRAYNHALKSFKKLLRRLKDSGDSGGKTEKSLRLNISKCLIDLQRYEDAKTYLNAILRVDKEPILSTHLHQSQAHKLLSICFLNQRKIQRACCHAYAALHKASSSSPLHDDMVDNAVYIYLMSLRWQTYLDCFCID